MTKRSPASGMCKGRSFDEQKDIMERCSILFNPTDFCLVICSGDSQQTRHREKSYSTLFSAALSNYGRLKLLHLMRTCSSFSCWEDPLFVSQSTQVFLQLLFFFHQQPRRSRGFLRKQYRIKVQGFEKVPPCSVERCLD